ncbi:MAG: hypothetical protein JRI97_10380 [Deltaproteobacteria bacterium]|nr:hypothetical protein [Deltaproteobacteria bacterium]
MTEWTSWISVSSLSMWAFCRRRMPATRGQPFSRPPASAKSEPASSKASITWSMRCFMLSWNWMATTTFSTRRSMFRE